MGLIDLVYPKNCFGCGKKGKYFCKSCLAQISLAPSSSFLFNQESYLNGAVGLFDYQGLVRLGIQKLKYRFLTDSREEWGKLMRIALGQKLTAPSGWRLKKFLLTKPTVVPVPLYWRRRNWRGFNQAEIIAQLVADNLKLTVNNQLVKRSKATRSQVGLKKSERQINMEKAFTVITKPPRSVLIVDDVWTSGATIKALAQVLRQKGSRIIWALTLAR